MLLDIFDAEAWFLRVYKDRPSEPFNEDEQAPQWAEIAKWERVRANFFLQLILGREYGDALRLAE
jgi:hypothetical protein